MDHLDSVLTWESKFCHKIRFFSFTTYGWLYRPGWICQICFFFGYWQVPLSKRAQEISAFITPVGLYSYKVMPFGLKTAPATFQHLMNRVVSGLKGCSVYLDDLIIYSDTWHSHLQRICALFDRLTEARLTINLAKCDFAMATVTYLGRVVGQGRVASVQTKVRAITEYPQPTTKKNCRGSWGWWDTTGVFAKTSPLSCFLSPNCSKPKWNLIGRLIVSRLLIMSDCCYAHLLFLLLLVLIKPLCCK